MAADDAPTSPRSSAIYYWGGDWSAEDANDENYVNREFEDDDNDAIDNDEDRHRRLRDDGGPRDDVDIDDRRIHRSDRRRRSDRDDDDDIRIASDNRRGGRISKFALSLQDDGDDRHWMFAPRRPRASSTPSSSSAPPPSSTPSLPSSSSLEDEDDARGGGGGWSSSSSGQVVLPPGDGTAAATTTTPSSSSSYPSSSSSFIVGGEYDVPPTENAGNDAVADLHSNDDASSSSAESCHSSSCDFDALPIVDLSLPDDVCAYRIGRACRDVGFFYVVNHGVDGIVMKNVMDASRIFFDIDVESKMRSSSASANRDGGGGDGGGGSSTMGGYRGYFDIGAEDLENRDGTRDLAAEEEGGGRRTASSVSHDDDDDDDDDDDSRNSTNGEVGRRQRRGGGDFKEGFDCGLEVDDDGGDDARVEFFGRNVWPDEVINPSLSGFRDALLRYQSELLSLSDRLLLALGRSLDHRDETSIVPEDYFVRRSRNPMCTLRLLHYPPGGDGSTGSTSLGCGAHTDYGLFTILMQDSIGGLQVRNRGGHWIDARPLKDSFVINVGDMLSRWTDGEYASTVHRVISPGGRGGRDHRYSVPFFFNPDHDAVVRPLRRRAGRRRLDDDEESDADGYDDGAHGYGRTALEILKDRYNGTFTKN